ncbi:putative holin-like toxin [Domibacillus indicus]|uniref:putative holin-like toxin n=1 Tax=Domibacillus indicus TaxID=1437523 RepID=UPI0037C14126
MKVRWNCVSRVDSILLIGWQTKSAGSWGNVCTTCPAQARGVLPMTTFQSLMLMIAFASLVVSIISLTQKK